LIGRKASNHKKILNYSADLAGGGKLIPILEITDEQTFKIWIDFVGD